MSDPAPSPSCATGPVRATLVAIACLLRALPLFVRGSPRTPLRALGIVALDIIHVTRHSRRLPRRTVSDMALLLDLEGCANQAWDRKGDRAADYQTIRWQLAGAGLQAYMDEYLDRLAEAEGNRPPAGGDRRRFDDVREYREAVVRLALATVAARALEGGRLEDGIRATRSDRDLETLFRIGMQCQIVDDLMDYAKDAAAGLPSFMTATASLAEAMELTSGAVRTYAAGKGRTPERALLPLRIALVVVTAMTRLTAAAASLRCRVIRPAPIVAPQKRNDSPPRSGPSAAISAPSSAVTISRQSAKASRRR
jgi:hypothetical protein